jgi:hypothetical protein
MLDLQLHLHGSIIGFGDRWRYNSICRRGRYARFMRGSYDFLVLAATVMQKLEP